MLSPLNVAPGFVISAGKLLTLDKSTMPAGLIPSFIPLWLKLNWSPLSVPQHDHISNTFHHKGILFKDVGVHTQ